MKPAVVAEFLWVLWVLCLKFLAIFYSYTGKVVVEVEVELVDTLVVETEVELIEVLIEVEVLEVDVELVEVEVEVVVE